MAKFVPVAVTEEQLEALDAEHDGVLHLQGSDLAPFCYVVRRPTAKEQELYRGALKSRGAAKANELLLRAVCVYPTGADIDRQLERWPASAGACMASDRFAEFFGGAVAAHQK